MRYVSSACALAIVVGCSSNGSPPPTSTSSQVSLRHDVLPLFQDNCATNSTCHGAPSGIEIYLAVDASKASALRTRVVGVAPEELPTMPYVTAGDPTQSYLMHKLDGDQGSLHCSGSIGCGDQMPKNAAALDAASRDRIRAWIAQGALDN